MKNKKTFADRLQYSIFNIAIPQKTSRKNIDAMIRVKLASVYPFSLEEKTVLILKNAADKKSRVAIVCDYDFFIQNKQNLCSSILAMKLLKRKTGTCICADSRFVEQVILEKGRFISSTVEFQKENVNISNYFSKNTSAVVFDALYTDRNMLQENEYHTPRFFDTSKLPAIAAHSARFIACSPKQKRKRIIWRMIFVMCLIAVGIIAAHQRIEMIAESRINEGAQAEKVRKLEMERKEKETLEANLKLEYTQYVLGMMPDMFDVCNKIFASIDPGTKIDNLSVTGNTFQFDARGNDAIRILNQYEENKYITEINLHRVVVEGEEDSFSFNGEVTKEIVYPDEKNLIDEKILFYQNALTRFHDEEILKRLSRPSHISNIIRKILSDNQCQLTSIQYYHTEYGLEIEYVIDAVSVSLFSFLKNVSVSKEHLVISSLRIRTYLEGGNISAVIRFRTGIVFDEERATGNIISADAASFMPEELAEYFIKRKENQILPEIIIELEEQVSIPQTIRNPPFLQYVGSVIISQAEQFVLLKDARYDSIIKLTNNSAEEHYVISNEMQTLELMYEGIMYEVQK
jgi:hypothetical protein